MAQRNDQVFQLSLTEIAFTIAFILLLLLGYLVSKEQTQRVAAEMALSKVQSAEKATAALENAKGAITAALQSANTSNPDEVITKLIAAEETRNERDHLKRRIEDLNAKLTALTELQNRVEKAATSEQAGIATEAVHSALVLQERLRKADEQEQAEDAGQLQQDAVASSAAASAPTSTAQSQPKALGATKPVSSDSAILDRLQNLLAVRSELKKQLRVQLATTLEPGKERTQIQEVVAAARSYGELAKAGVTVDFVKKENSDLRGQVAFLKNRLDARGGRDYPPCWADENGKVQFLFTVETKPDVMVVTQGWPTDREADARALPGIGEVLSGSPHSSSSFVSRIQGIFNWSKAHDPQCRHYVQLKSSIADAVQSDRARLLVENYFYKTEVRR